MKTTLNVQGMSCQHCVNSIEGALKTKGVAAKVDLSAEQVVVEFDEKKITINDVKETIEEQGYDVV